jgi:hypothetical protein
VLIFVSISLFYINDKTNALYIHSYFDEILYTPTPIIYSTLFFLIAGQGGPNLVPAPSYAKRLVDNADS